MKIIWSPLAIDRVAEIAQYIAQDSPNSAQKWVESTFQIVERLEKFPKSGHIVPEIKQDDFREIIHGNYRIIYRLQNEIVSILTVRHGRQILSIDEIKA
ncbi:MAG: type II toxin-antitoxin system RelE/ParE family toxin [Methylococcales symbiont of Hymedesmia sp. n. MRB-2018]|nr:MAG: type II toxin-antitoxin system RelE/ParE family toxin [Methylococcales symbiont of Hymedesmia sp. n. MRB-2018]KAF3983789.1 MAG: type II toxin-antitoxin system RelE/ParE family toxin [Methylococcales symbiont of Hymedesmia sp. n. MRB-2018]